MNAGRCARQAVAAGIFLFLHTSAARGQDRAAAEAAFDEGRQLATNGRYAEACLRFEASERLDPAVGSLLNLAPLAPHCPAAAAARDPHKPRTSRN